MSSTELAQIPEGALVLKMDNPVPRDTEEHLVTEKTDDKERGDLVEKLSDLWKSKFWPGDHDHFHEVTRRSQNLIPFLNANRPVPDTVVLYGSAGVGKTTLAKRCLLDWAESNLGQFQYAFYLNCRELACMPPCTFAELISKDCPELQEDILAAVARAERVLFVVDGFDELRVPLGMLICDICGDWKAQKPVPILLSSLLKKKMVPNATLLVTTQPRALQDFVLLVYQPRFVEMEGFSEQDRKEYFQRYFKDEDQARRAFDAMRCSAALFRMGSAPAVCQLVCACLELQMQRGQDPRLACQSPTSLFLQFLCGQFTPAAGGCAQRDLRAPLEALCLLAAQGLWTQQLSWFDNGDLGRLGVTESHLHPFLDRHILQRDEYCEGCFSFVHLSVQQFLAAMFYILKLQEQGKRDSLRWDSEDIGDVCTLFSREARARNPSLTQAGHFLFGLLNKKRAQELEATFGCQTSLEVQKELLKCGAEETQPFLLKMDLREVLYCLYESGEEELVKDAMVPFEDVSLHVKSSEDLLHAVFCLRHCRKLRSLSLQVDKSFFPEKDREAPLSAYLQGGKFQPNSDSLCRWVDLCPVVCSENLTSLDISKSFLSNPSVRILCYYITRASCRLQKVVISKVSPVTAYYDFCLALVGKSTLTHLTLVGYIQEDMTLLFMLLGEILKHAKCALQYLRLGHCFATTEQWADFFFALRASHSLLSLDLSDNELMDEGVELLCETLRHPKCFLQKLSLANCHLTEACCKELTSVLIVNQRLTHLCLAKNDLGDGGVKILCEGLGYPECKLQTLVLRYCNITEHGCKSLSKLLHGDCELVNLDLSLNPIALGLWSLCDALRAPYLNLQHLGLWGCAITPLYCQELASALTSNKKLETLDLGQNALGLTGVTVLLEALKERSGPLKMLRLKIDDCHGKLQNLLKKVKESNPSLTIENVIRANAPSYFDFFSAP